MPVLIDPTAQFIIGTILALLAILVPIYLVLRQRKALSYEVISFSSIISEYAKDKLIILYNAIPVENVRLLVIRLVNSGNIPITPTDYERSVRLAFAEGSQVLTAEVVATIPANLLPKISPHDSRVEIESLLLNSGDSIVMNILIAGTDGSFEFDGRIAGVKKINRVVEGGPRFIITYLSGIALTIFGLIFLVQALTRPGSTPQDVALYNLLIAMGYVLMLIGLLVYSPRRRRQRILRLLRAPF